MSSAFVRKSQRCRRGVRRRWACAAGPWYVVTKRRQDPPQRDGAEERRPRLAGTRAAQPFDGYPEDDFVGAVTPWYYADQRHGHGREGARGRAAAGARHLHVEGLLRRPRPLDGQAVLPLQQPDRARLDLGRLLERPAGARERQPGDGGLGSLRSRLPSRGHRQPVSVQDRAGALRGVARRDQGAWRPDRAHEGHDCPTGTAATPGT